MQTIINLVQEWIPRLQAFGVVMAGFWAVVELIKSQKGRQSKEEAKEHLMWLIQGVIGMYVVLEVIKQIAGSLG